MFLWKDWHFLKLLNLWNHVILHYIISDWVGIYYRFEIWDLIGECILWDHPLIACDTHTCYERNFSWDNVLRYSLVHSAPPFMSCLLQKLPNPWASMSPETKNIWIKFLYYPPIHNSPNFSWAWITWREKDKSHRTKPTWQALSMGCYFFFSFPGSNCLRLSK